MSIDVGDRIGDYEIVDKLGGGGVGAVFKARHEITGRMEALKVLRADREDDPEQAERFLREVQVQAALDHPNIAGVRTAFRHGDGVVMIQELVDGESLASLRSQRPLSLEEAVSYGRQALAALAYAHERGVVHRDVKPANMIVRPDGRLKVTDFGLAKTHADPSLTESGIPIGSPYYMAPEQVRGKSTADARADVYAMGVVLYELTTGRLPFPGESAVDVMMAHLEQAPPPPIEIEPGLPPALNALILQALAKDPKVRFQSASQMSAALNSVDPSSVPAPQPPPVGSRKPKVRLAAGLALVAVFLAWGALRFVRYAGTPAPGPAVSDAGGSGSDTARLNSGDGGVEAEPALADEPSAETPPSEPSAAPTPSKSSPFSTAAGEAEPENAVSEASAAAEPSPSQERPPALPDRITVRLTRGFGSDSEPGTALDARIVRPASLAGVAVGGEVLAASSSGKPRGESVVRYAVTALYRDGQAVPIDARTIAFRNSSGDGDADDLGAEVKHRSGVFRRIGSSVRRLFRRGRDEGGGHPNQAAGRAPRIQFAAGSEIDLEIRPAR